LTARRYFGRTTLKGSITTLRAIQYIRASGQRMDAHTRIGIQKPK
jgi:hypothetical protein